MAYLINFKVCNQPQGPTCPPLSNLIACPSFIQSSPTDFVVFHECTQCASTSEPSIQSILLGYLHISLLNASGLCLKVFLSVRTAMTILYKTVSPLFLQTLTSLPLFIFLHRWHFASSDIIHIYLLLKYWLIDHISSLDHKLQEARGWICLLLTALSPEPRIVSAHSKHSNICWVR